MTDPQTNTGTDDDGPQPDHLTETGEWDLDAAYAEVARPPLSFRWAGQSWLLTHARELDWRTIEKIDTDDLTIGTIREVLQAAFDDQWAAFAETHQPTGMLEKLFNRWLQHSGVDRGESQSSADSSGDTAEPSKQTSPGSTGSGSRKPSSAGRKAGTRRGNS